ncbi:endonuclease/exonuclease/phosphatase family protein [Metabacillus arenae]|uniref:Endonuclease/exonuclease/phosphatase family protein n=1 Tax=Metabacillus arenae TaxID=2771434 RepID=A0A926RWN3_9BACI|nr:endonuclease/exonuclease/phosphatase family protein [Metabacillus arenae]MBD1379760.1 endonuclease/exonuclease/phosphatase family protein [Metabacillus arenae]
MKLLTLNCHSWQEENQLAKIRYLAETIKENSYDVIALQEVSQLIKSELATENLKTDNFGLLLLKELEKLGIKEYQLVWDAAHIGYDIYEEGLAILTKHPIVQQESFFISQSEDVSFWKARKIVKVVISYQSKEISFYSCHLGWWNDEEEPFKQQADRIMKDITSTKLSILMGDFNNNAYIRNEGYDYLIQQGLYDTYDLAKEKDSGITVKGKIAGWDENMQDLRIDLILMNQPLKTASSRVIFNGVNYNVISDHFGVEVVLDI